MIANLNEKWIKVIKLFTYKAKPACLLCRRKFKTIHDLQEHNEKSKLHYESLKLWISKRNNNNNPNNNNNANINKDNTNDSNQKAILNTNNTNPTRLWAKMKRLSKDTKLNGIYIDI